MRIREHLLTAQEKPVPVNIGDQFVDGDGKAMGYIGVALQVQFHVFFFFFLKVLFHIITLCKVQFLIGICKDEEEINHAIIVKFESVSFCRVRNELQKKIFQSAFYELLHGTSFTKSLIAAISRGGDTDTNAAIVGALLGKVYFLLY